MLRAEARGVDPAWVAEQIEARAEARKQKDFEQADEYFGYFGGDEDW